MEEFFTIKRKIWLSALAFLLAANFFAWQEAIALSAKKFLEVYVLDVGQGDAIFIKTPAGHQIIIDGGPDSNVLARLRNHMPFWDRSIDMVILTHPDRDHVAGLILMLKKYKVKYVLWTGAERRDPMYEAWVRALEAAKSRGTSIIAAYAGERIISGKAVMDVLNPFENIVGKKVESARNDTSVLTRLAFGQTSFLFTGDITSKLENELVAKGAPIASDVLKVAHHGSKYSTSELFLEAVQPSMAVISSGKGNPYGHPAQEVLQNLQKFGITILRTDQLGDVEIVSDGKNIKIKK